MKKSLLIAGCSAALAGIMLMAQNNVAAHGYVKSPPSRVYEGKLDKEILGWNEAFKIYGFAQDNAAGIEGPKGFPLAGPEDGKIASANERWGNELDIQTPSLWKKQDVKTGENSFTWEYEAPHPTSKWHYYMTKTGWDPNKTPTRNDLELIETINHDGSLPNTNLTHQVTIPEDRSGYHIILAVWDVEDTGNAFYNVIDVNVEGGQETAPTKPTELKADHVTSNTVDLSWKGQTEATSYIIYRNGEKVDEVTSPTFKDTNLEANTKYTYEIQAKNKVGESPKSDVLEIITHEEGSEEKPAAPGHLHTMDVTANSVDLMFRGSEHSSGIKEYQIFRDGEKVGTTTSTSYTDKNLQSSTEYSYQVLAVANNGETSDLSEALKVTTKETEAGEHRVFKLGEFTNPELYQAGEIVEYNGLLYTVLQTHNNYGDVTWAPDLAPALFSVQE